jgi:hypothetical protein
MSKSKSISETNNNLPSLPFDDLVQKIPQIIEKAKSELALLKKTDKTIDFNINIDGVNVNTVEKCSDVVFLLAKVRILAAAYEEARTELGGHTIGFEKSGKNLEQLVEILTAKYNLLLNENKIKQLEKQINDLSTFLPEQEKLKSTILNIVDSMSAPLQ